MLLVFFTYQARLKKPKNYKLETQNTNKSKKPNEINLNFKTQKVKNQWRNMIDVQRMARVRSKTQ